MSYTWDSLNRLSAVVDNRLPLDHNTTTYTFDVASNLATMTYPNGVQSTFAYDSINRVSGVSSPVSSYAYQRGPTGALSSVAEQSGRSANWSYDNTWRLTQEQIASDPVGNNGTVNYSLDPVGNRSQEASSISGLPSVSLTFNADDLTSGETYDANGNTTYTGGRTFAYDSQNHLWADGGHDTGVNPWSETR